jgi:23S rRNA (uracil1939-C5)-methyltransferase
MRRRKKPLPIIENILIERVAAEGKSLARVNDKVVFVPLLYLETGLM